MKLSARIEHVPRDNKTYAVIEVKYGDRTEMVELDIEKLKRSALLTNLAAIATDDAREFYKGHVSHITTSPVQAAERLLMWAIFMPGKYVLNVGYVKETEEGLSPYIEIRSHFGQGGIKKIEKSPIHHIVLKLAKELAGGKKLNVDEVLAASWLMISAILSTPDGGRPSDGLAVLVEKGILPRAALDRLRPIFEELDALLGPISRADKAQLVGKMVDYDGSVADGLLKVGAKKIKEIPIELGGIKVNMADVAEAAAKAFSEKGGWSVNELYFGPAKEALELEADKKAPLNAGAFKIIAALIARERRDKADELRRKELVEYVELARYEIGELKIKITSAMAKEEGEQTPITQENLEEIRRGFKDRNYTHLRLAIKGEEYDLGSKVEDRKGGRVTVRFVIYGERAQKLAEALKELGLKDVKVTPSGYLYLRYEHLEELLSAGVKAYAAKKAKMGDAMWRLEITYEGMTMELEMTYDKRNNRLEKIGRTGKIKVFIREEGASEGKRVKLDLDLLAAIREGQLAVIKEGCKNLDNCLEKQFAEALSAASEMGFKWSVTNNRKRLYAYLPGDFRDAVRRLK